MRQRATVLILAVAVSAVAVSGCTNVRRALGADKVTPDEFRVVTIAPLTVPPEFNLRPPRPGEPRPEEIYPDQRARAALLGTQSDFEGTDGEILLVARAGASESDPFIRDIIDGETASLVQKSREFSDQVLFWRRAGATVDATTIDAEAEAERLANEQAHIQAATGGQPVTIQRRGGGGFRRLPGL